jgi:hypothetical protein
MRSIYYLLRCNTASSVQKVEAVSSYRMLVTMYQTIQHDILEEIVFTYLISELCLSFHMCNI